MFTINSVSLRFNDLSIIPRKRVALTLTLYFLLQTEGVSKQGGNRQGGGGGGYREGGERDRGGQ